jgi:hypothetical protein
MLVEILFLIMIKIPHGNGFTRPIKLSIFSGK